MPALELDEQGDDMAPHVAVKLLGILPIRPMVVRRQPPQRTAHPQARTTAPRISLHPAPAPIIFEPQAIEDYVSHVRAQIRQLKCAHALSPEERLGQEGTRYPIPSQGRRLKGLLGQRLQFGLAV